MFLSLGTKLGPTCVFRASVGLCFLPPAGALSVPLPREGAEVPALPSEPGEVEQSSILDRSAFVLVVFLLCLACDASAASSPPAPVAGLSNSVPSKTNSSPAVTSNARSPLDATVSRMLAEALARMTNSPTNPAATETPAPDRDGAEPLPGRARPTNSLASALSSTNTLDDKLKLGTGDRLSYRVVEDLEEPKALTVTDSGDVEVPLIGRIPALGKTCKQLAADIKAKLDEEYYYNATVVIAIDLFNRTRGKVYLVGYVRAPGPLDIPSDELFTLGKAILRAGGFSEYADKKRVRITRKGSDAEPMGKNIEVDVGAVLEEGRGDKDVKLEVGDLIYVPSRLFKF